MRKKAKSLDEKILDNLLAIRNGMITRLSELDLEIEIQRKVIFQNRDNALREECGLLPTASLAKNKSAN